MFIRFDARNASLIGLVLALAFLAPSISDASSKRQSPVKAGAQTYSVSGRLVFPEGEAPPEDPIELGISYEVGGNYSGRFMPVFPPDFLFDFEVPANSSPTLSTYLDETSIPFRGAERELGPVNGDVWVDLELPRGVVVEGNLSFPNWVDAPATPVSVYFFQDLDRPTEQSGATSVFANPPDFKYRVALHPNRSTSVRFDAPHPFGGSTKELGSFSRDTELDFFLAAPPRLIVEGAKVMEGASGATRARFTVRLSSRPTPGATHNYLVHVQDGTAKAGMDYLAPDPQTKLLTFHSNWWSEEFDVKVFGDGDAEDDEFFELVVTDLSTGSKTGSGLGVVVDDDGSDRLMLWPLDQSSLEGNHTDDCADVPLILSDVAPPEGVRARVSTVAGSARPYEDFMPLKDVEVEIASGDDRVIVCVPLLADAVREADESFTLQVSNIEGAVSAKSTATAIIRNDDGYPLVERTRARPDHYALQRGGRADIPANVGVLANDIVPESGAGSVGQLLGNSSPEFGSLTMAADGSFVYVPAPGYTGRDSFVYYVLSTNGYVNLYSYGKVDLTISEPLASTDQYLWLAPPASNSAQEAFVRLTNRGTGSGGVTIWGIDSSGRRSAGTVTLDLDGHQSTHINSLDLEQGSAEKGLRGALGPGDGNWMLVVRSTLEIDALAYIRTPDGFVTSMHDRVQGDGVDWFVPIFNPASNLNQASRLRIINTSMVVVDVRISGVDDSGRSGRQSVTATLPPLASREFDAVDLEQGNRAKGLIGKLGDGDGKWRLTVSATDRVTVQNLLADPMGYLTNLSTFSTSTIGGEQVLWMVTPAEETQQQGFLRLTNLSNRAGTVSLWGVDDQGQRSPGTATLTLGANATQHLNSQDLEHGNPAKGLSGSLGDGEGDWRIFLSTDLDLLPMGLIRTPNGFVTTMHDLVLETSRNWRVPIFNPGSNPNQVSVLRVVNPGSTTVRVSIAGTDDSGQTGPGGTASFSLAPQAAVEFTAHELEQGSAARGLVGSLGDGEGKWWLQVSADAEVKVVNMLRDPNGYLTNLSNATRDGASQLDP